MASARRRRPDRLPYLSTGAFSYSGAVISTHLLTSSLVAIGVVAGSACVGPSPRPLTDSAAASTVFYTVTGEIALSRHEVRVAALQYTAATEMGHDPQLLRRATQVSADCLQPSLAHVNAARWIAVEDGSVDAHHAAARALLDLDRIEESAAQYRLVVSRSPRGADAEFAALETEFAADGDVYGARQVADRVAAAFPSNAAALRMQAFTVLRADDPKAAAPVFEAALTAFDAEPAPTATPSAARRELTEGWWRARILAGDKQEPLEQARALLARAATVENRLDYALLLLAAQDETAAQAELAVLTEAPDARPVALRLLGLLDFQHARFDAAAVRFAELAHSGRFTDEAVYYLGLIAERQHDFERALGLYTQVQSGDSALPALLHAAAILEAHGAAAAGDELLDRLIDAEPERAPEILVARARMVADAEQRPKAIALLQRAELQYPDSVDLRYALASMSDDAGQTAVAIDILKKIVTQRPSDPAALNAYGYTLADHHLKLGEARRLIERAYQAAPKSPAILDSLGWVLYRQGRAGQALPYLDAAYADEQDGDIAAHLGEVLWRLDRHADAERIWSEARARDADNRLLKATLQRLHQS